MNTSYTPGFSLFWSLWPSKPVGRKVGKCKVFETWKRECLEDNYMDVCLALVDDIYHNPYWDKSRDKTYIPMPQTWFNQCRWDRDFDREKCMWRLERHKAYQSFKQTQQWLRLAE